VTSDVVVRQMEVESSSSSPSSILVVAGSCSRDLASVTSC